MAGPHPPGWVPADGRKVVINSGYRAVNHNLKQAQQSSLVAVGTIMPFSTFNVAAGVNMPTHMIFDGTDWLVLDIGDSSVYNRNQLVSKMDEIEDLFRLADQLGVGHLGHVTLEQKAAEYAACERRLYDEHSRDAQD